MTQTKGPWGVNSLAANNPNVCLTGPDGTKSPLGYIVQTPTTPIAAMIQTEADARLIAAAPDLLAACEEMAAQLGGGDDYTKWEDAKAHLLAAIAKAKGN